VTKTIYRLLFAVVFVCLLFTCGCANPLSDLKQLLKENEEKWTEQSQLFSRNYTYTLQIGCFCPNDITSPVNVIVLNGETYSVVYQSDGQTVTNSVLDAVNTIEDLFKIIRNAINEKVDKLTVEYDPILGYPKTISIDPIETAVDEERAYTILDFALLK
jgi:hypothetical protein